jgi:hypothetical protein
MKGLRALLPRRRITCPQCFTTFAAREVHFRCMDPHCPRWGEVKRPAAGGGVPVMGHVFAAPQRGLRSAFGVVRKAACDACGVEASKRLCGTCHFELTHDAGLVDERVIAIIGGRNTGKSHYIAGLVHRLEHEVGGNFGWGLRMVGDATRTRFERDFRGPLFRQKKVLQQTQTASVMHEVKTPMVFRLTFERGGRRAAINLSFFDTAGEDMKSLDAMSAETRYITRAAGLIFLLDPLQVPAVRERLPAASLPEYDAHSEPAYLIDRLRDLFESQGGVGATQRVPVPVAFALSKVDAIFPLIDPGSLLRRPGEHFGAVRMGEIRSLHTEMWGYLDSWMGSGFNQRIEQGFARFRYFGVSALGGAPDAQGRLETVAPTRVEDPFLWILMELGLLRGK